MSRGVDLFDVSVHQIGGGFVAEVEGGAGFGFGVGVTRARGGETEAVAGRADFRVEAVGHLQADRPPVGGLAAELVQLAAGQLDADAVRLRPLDQGRRRRHQPAGPVDFPGHGQVAALVDVPDQPQFVALDGDLRGRGHVIVAAGDARPVEVA